MAKVIVLGSGFSGHTSAAYLRKDLGNEHEVVMITPNSNWQYIPSNIWIGVGEMTSKSTVFPLTPIYKRKNITFIQAKVISFHPEGDQEIEKGFVLVEYVNGSKQGTTEKVDYDFLVNSTGPRLDFEATEGLMPGTNKTVSVCSFDHAEHAWKELKKSIDLMKKGQKQRFVVGTGHGLSTCQGAAFEYVLNLEQTLRKYKVRDKAEITWISNEIEVGDFGMDGMTFSVGGKVMSSKDLGEMLFEDRGIKWIVRSAVNKVEDGKAHYENMKGEYKSIEFDFAMLIPKFSGHGFKSYDKNGVDNTGKLFKAFMIVDADYTPRPYEEWTVQDWPETYQNPSYSNIFAAGIAFHPPHAISKPHKSKNGTAIAPAPPRTGMPSAITGKIVSDNIVHMIKSGKNEIIERGSMGNMGAACVASSGYGNIKGSAVTMIIEPIVPNYVKHPEYGRPLRAASMGLSGHWIKKILHHMFIYKAKMYPGWNLIPE